MKHISVLLNQSIDALNIKKDGVYIDATVGAGGHSVEILKHGGKVVGIEQDEKMLEVAENNLKIACPSDKEFIGSVTLNKANFKDIDLVASKCGITHVDGVLMDLGISSLHLDVIERGFSFRKPDQPLDMRLDENLGVRAADLLNSLDKKSLIKLFEDGDVDNAYHLANKVIKRREEKLFEKVSDLLSLFPNHQNKKTHPATKAMMALRMAVNTELQVLEEALPKAFSLLKNKGRLVVISFHSGEDRIVKNYFAKMQEGNLAKIITKKPIIPTNDEIKFNKRSRSAKLRILEKNENSKIEKNSSTSK